MCIHHIQWTGDTAAAFEKHVATYGGLDICINGAGISNPIPFQKDQTDGTRSWRFTLDVNLIAVIDCTQKAVCLKFDLPSWFTLILGCSCSAYCHGLFCTVDEVDICWTLLDVKLLMSEFSTALRCPKAT